MARKHFGDVTLEQAARADLLGVKLYHDERGWWVGKDSHILITTVHGNFYAKSFEELMAAIVDPAKFGLHWW